MKKVDCKNSLKRARARDAAGGLGALLILYILMMNNRENKEEKRKEGKTRQIMGCSLI